MAEHTTKGIRPPILSQFVTLRLRSLINRKPIVLQRTARSTGYKALGFDPVVAK